MIFKVISIVVIAVCAILLLVAAARNYFHWRKASSIISAFAAGVAHSISRDHDAWDYDASETWLCSHKANLSISLQEGNFGRCNIWAPRNGGSNNITTFVGADLLAFTKALDEWKCATAVDRQHRVEKYKRDALIAMGEENRL